MSIQAVLFDLDDTLLWDDRSVLEAFEMVCESAADRLGVDARELEAAVRKEARALYESYETFPFTQMIGINPYEALWGNFTEGEHEQFRKLNELAPGYRKEAWTRALHVLGVDDEQAGAELGELFHQTRRKLPYVYEETYRVLDELKGKVKLLLLTNGSPDLQKEKLAMVPLMAPYFDHIMISGQFGQGKPAEAIFHHAMELLNINADEGLMVGDKLTTDILGSNRVGMKNVWINRRGLANDSDIRPTFQIKHLEELHDIIHSFAE
ncbi:haloacid dehalogenase [Paenibacillus swuensis]|uniref:Phosphoserine phosphatase n=1 Tax=Paenibacillus swuensis TaxID=1178515 RepID=A0A172TLF7_9BACL|nr:HAD family hydrolase [Paenibacillus swuensis]ANE47868.1 haloacid dehalogenase [Paenibacillus swuensis]